MQRLNHHQPLLDARWNLRLTKRDRLLLLDLIHNEVHPDSGTRYPCKLRHLRRYLRPPERMFEKPWDQRYATSRLLEFLNTPIKPGSREHKALHRIAAGLELRLWGPDLSIKAFDDLDIVFFNGTLAKQTQISWKTEQEMKYPNMAPIGVTYHLGYGRCHIVLNATQIFLKANNPRAQMWQTMLHEMVHGYFFVVCEYDQPSRSDLGKGEQWLDGHGRCFREILTAIDRRLHEHFSVHAIAGWEPYNLDLCGRFYGRR